MLDIKSNVGSEYSQVGMRTENMAEICNVIPDKEPVAYLGPADDVIAKVLIALMCQRYAEITLDGAEALLDAFEASARPREVAVATDIRIYPAGLALLLLFALYGLLPLYEALSKAGYAMPRPARAGSSNLKLKEAQS